MKKTPLTSLPSRLEITNPHLLLLFVLFFIGLLYSNTLNSPLVLDDRAGFIDNPAVYIDNLSLTSLRQIYETRFGQNRFIPMLSFAIDHMFSEGHIAQFHRTNILVHILATIAVYLLIQGLTTTAVGQKNLVFIPPGYFSLFVTALWALHPIQTNAVTYLVQRMASLAALFYFASLGGYVWARIGKSGKTKALAGASSFIFMLCAFISKENTATLPLAILMIEIIFITPELGQKLFALIHRRHWLLFTVIILLVMPLAATKLTAISNGYTGRHFNLVERLFTEFRVVVFYLSLLALPLPSRLNLDHDFAVSNTLWNPLTTTFSLLLLSVLIFAAFRYRHRYPLVAFGIFFFFLNLLIESTIIPLELVFEHRLYLPSLGFIVAIMSLLDRSYRLVPATSRNEREKIFFLGILIILCTLMIATSLRNHVWRNKLTLYEDIASKSPLKPRAYANMGMELMKVGRYGEALTAQQKAISLGKGQSEEYIAAANNIVSIFFAQKKYQEAAAQAENLIRDLPRNELNANNFPILMAQLAFSYRKIGRLSDSFEAYLIGIKIHHPQHTALLLRGMEDMLIEASASKEGRRQLNMNSGTEEVYCKMAITLFMIKDYRNARTYLAKALAITPEHEKSLDIKKIIDDETTKNRLARMKINSTSKPEAYTNLRFKSAFYLAKFFETKYTLLDNLVGPLLKKAVQLKPESLSAALKLAQWHLQNGEIGDALELAESHLLKNQDNPTLLELAGKCYSIQGEIEKTKTVLIKLLDIYPGHPNWKKYKKFIQES